MSDAKELISFLNSPQEQIANIALESSLPFTQANAGQTSLFQENDFFGARSIKKLSLKNSSDTAITNALIALINLSDKEEIRSDLASDAEAIRAYAKQIASTPKPSYVKFACMLLSNLAREAETVAALRGPLLAALVLTYAKPANLLDEEFDFLGFAFNEFARIEPISIVKLIPHVIPQLALGGINRRRAVAATIKNCLFDASTHAPLANDTPLIETIMICLTGPEALSEEDATSLPPMVQKNLGPEKKRESDIGQQYTLIECLLLLSSSQEGRDALRLKNTYYTIRELHKVSEDPNIVEICEKFVNMVMRGDPSEKAEPSQPKKQRQSHDGDDDDDDAIVEVV